MRQFAPGYYYCVLCLSAHCYSTPHVILGGVTVMRRTETNWEWTRKGEGSCAIGGEGRKMPFT